MKASSASKYVLPEKIYRTQESSYGPTISFLRKVKVISHTQNYNLRDFIKEFRYFLPPC